MSRKMRIIGILLVGLLFAGGCATLGPVYQKVEKMPEGTGVVYIYRPHSVIGAAVTYDVKVGETVVTTLHNGGYYPYFAKPGEVEFRAKTESESAVTLDVKAGQPYYIKGTVGVGFFVGRPHLMVVPAEAAQKEIAKCKLIPEARSDAGK